MNFILYAVPFFFLLIGLELVLEKLRKTDYYRTNDAINSLTAGVLSQMVAIAKGLVPFTVYVLIFQHFAFFTLPDTLLVGIIVFVLYDFCYYWNHRMGHEMSLLWAAHVVHHSSEEYNLTTALRQSSSSIFSFIFYLPLALLGVEPMLLIAVGSLNLIYQFWVHTRHVPKLGWFEWIFVSPSNHRVHHAQNRVYIDRNYGGVFILWDRLFGTFQEELDEEPVIFGIRSSLKSWNPLYANVQLYWQLWCDSWHTARWQDKLRVWFGRTGWRPDDVAERFPIVKTDLKHFNKFDIALPTITKLYCVWQHIFTTFVALLLMLFAAQLNLVEQLSAVAVVMFIAYSVGMVLEQRTFAPWLEWAKHGVVIASLVMAALPTWLMLSLSVFILISAPLLVAIQRLPVRPVNLDNQAISH